MSNPTIPTEMSNPTIVGTVEYLARIITRDNITEPYELVASESFADEPSAQRWVENTIGGNEIAMIDRAKRLPLIYDTNYCVIRNEQGVWNGPEDLPPLWESTDTMTRCAWWCENCEDEYEERDTNGTCPECDSDMVFLEGLPIIESENR